MSQRARPGPSGPVRYRPTPQHLRRRRVVLFAVVALLLLAGLGVGGRVLLYDSGLADVEHVQVTGVLTVETRDVLAAAAIEPGEPLVAVDVDAVASRVAAVPAVASARVGRHWPDTVSIEVTERVAVALAEAPQGLVLVDATGVAFRPAPPVPPALPRLTFTPVGAGDPATTAALAVLAALPEALRAQVETVRVAGSVTGGPPFVTLGLTGDRQVRWGPPDRSDSKAAVLGPLLTRRGSVYDVASPELPTISR